MSTIILTKEPKMSFLPLTPEELNTTPDFIIVTGDAYVDHPSFGTAVIGRVLEDAGFSVAIIAQPDWHTTDDIQRFGAPRLAFLVNSGNVDSMVAHYTVAKKRRNDDYYSPGGVSGKRPDRAVTVYCNLIRRIYGKIPIIIGGVEASTRRFAHYDYWTDKLRRSILIDSGADLLTYGMGENILRRVAFLLDKGVPIGKIRDVKGTCFAEKAGYIPKGEYEDLPDFDTLCRDKRQFAEAFALQYKNQDPARGKILIEHYGDRVVVHNPPMPPLTQKELDAVYELPYERDYHPYYRQFGGVPAIDEVKFSITHCRGCYGNCNFCSIAFTQGRTVVSRSIDSVVREAEILTKLRGFKGYIHDVGGPTANFAAPVCKNQADGKPCPGKECLYPSKCKNAVADHSRYIEMLRAVRNVKGVKKVFIRSGIRHDFVNADRSDEFITELALYHTGGQLRLAPEHVSKKVLDAMGKPPFEEYERFKTKFDKISQSHGLDQYVLPYLMSSHPGSTMGCAVDLALYLRKNRIKPEQVQDFYPTPGTASTCMFYSGIDPFTGKSIYVPRSPKQKAMQRALLQTYDKKNAPLIKQALAEAGRSDLEKYLIPKKR